MNAAQESLRIIKTEMGKLLKQLEQMDERNMILTGAAMNMAMKHDEMECAASCAACQHKTECAIGQL